MNTAAGEEPRDPCARLLEVCAGHGMLDGSPVVVGFEADRKSEAAMLLAYLRTAGAPAVPKLRRSAEGAEVVRLGRGHRRWHLLVVGEDPLAVPGVPGLAGAMQVAGPPAGWGTESDGGPRPPAVLHRGDLRLKTTGPWERAALASRIPLSPTPYGWRAGVGVAEGRFVADAAVTYSRHLGMDGRLAGSPVEILLSDGRATEVSCTDVVLHRFLNRLLEHHGLSRVDSVFTRSPSDSRDRRVSALGGVTSLEFRLPAPAGRADRDADPVLSFLSTERTKP
ncbi:hypothetical protein L0U85_15005 [Glycomyces sp. L485]|uniref:hypothetical protein n=1 Tax=Glycomyces sp. L485 TaxID=2909235 RepID=UPI001F4A4ABD|nr:hypothetical protein [Glycomyces sp. L485]MCH7232155.1 hypothetical protein [Glycomyces sp. L485]